MIKDLCKNQEHELRETLDEGLVCIKCPLIISRLHLYTYKRYKDPKYHIRGAILLAEREFYIKELES